MIKYMSEKYYREINTNKDLVKFKLQLGTILLKLNEHDLNIKNDDKDITKINTDIKNNDKDIKSNYDICISNGNNLTDIYRKLYTIDNNIAKINNDIEKINKKDIIKHNYSIENIWSYNIDILNTYTITPSNPIIFLFEYIIEGKFITNSILEISCKMMYKYIKHNDIGLLRHIYSLLDNNDNLIYSHNIIHTNAGDNLANHLTMNDDFSILFKNSHTNKMKMKLQVGKVDVNKAGNIGFKIMNPYNNIILCIKHIKYLSEL